MASEVWFLLWIHFSFHIILPNDTMVFTECVMSHSGCASTFFNKGCTTNSSIWFMGQTPHQLWKARKRGHSSEGRRNMLPGYEINTGGAEVTHSNTIWCTTCLLSPPYCPAFLQRGQPQPNITWGLTQPGYSVWAHMSQSPAAVNKWYEGPYQKW